MNSREILTLKQQVFNCLAKKQLKEAFEAMAKLVVNTQDWNIKEKLNELENTYKYMLHYMFEGVNDPKRDAVYNDIVRSIYTLAEDATDELLLLESPNYFYERLRLDSLKATTFDDYFKDLKDLSSSLALIDLLESGDEKRNKIREYAVKRERTGVLLFNNIFTSARASKDTITKYSEFLDSYEINTREKCLFISALMLNIFHRFDPLKINVLLDSTESEIAPVKARAIVGLVLVLHVYDDRWNLYPDLQSRLDTLTESPDFRKSVLSVIIQLIRARDTERISKKVTEEIIPQMMKFGNLAGKKLSMEDLMGETDFMDKNPDWQKELEESGLSKKLQEYSELQMEGADVFHSTFANLKSFPFFSEMSNWFLPFDKNYSEIAELFPESKENSILSIAIADSGHMCNSDKYSFSLSLTQIPSSQREAMMSRMGAESEEVKRMQKEAKAMNPTIDNEILSNQYIQDLYRFYKLSPKRNNFFDIFKLSLNFYNKVTIAPIISDNDSMNQIANYCFDKNNFDVALSIYLLIVKKGNETGTTWQKIAYCYQIQNDKEKALEAYIKADLLAPDKTWTLRRIAQLYRTLNEPLKALEYYQKVKQLTPDNLNVELNIGHCYLELKRYDDALNSYFKVEILDTKSNKAHRPIAWTAFLLNKYDVAENYYNKILKDDKDTPTVHDYLNAGHLQLTLGNMQNALELYKNAALLSQDIEHFEALMIADKDTLIIKGVDSNIFPYLSDKIKYMLD